MATCDKTIFNRLKRTEGQLRGIQKMLEENQMITKELAIENKVIVIRRGKKKYYLGLFD